jgi:hypothetical protein
MRVGPEAVDPASDLTRGGPARFDENHRENTGPAHAPVPTRAARAPVLARVLTEELSLALLFLLR